MRQYLLLFVMLSFFVCELRAQDGSNGKTVNPIITSVPFLRIIPDARSGAMGDVGIALSPSAMSMHHNASLLAFADKRMSFGLSYVPWLSSLNLNDTYLAYLSGYTKLDEIQSIGVSLRYFDYGSIDYTNFAGISQGSGDPNEFEIAGAYARRLSDNFSVAATLKFIYSNIASGQQSNGEDVSVATAGAADLSFTYKRDLSLGNTDSELTTGLSMTNLGSKISYVPSRENFLPANIGLGVGWKLNMNEYNSFTFLVDVNKYMVPTPCFGENCPDNTEDVGTIASYFNSFGDGVESGEEFRELYYSFGAEYWYNEQFALRAGYFSEHETKGARKFTTVGLGINYSTFNLNLSYLIPTTNRNPLDNTFRFTLIWNMEDY